MSKALSWMKRGAEFERKARVIEKKREKYERQTWPQAFCEQCRKHGKSTCFLHRDENLDMVPGKKKP